MKTFSETIIDFCAGEKENGLLLASKDNYIDVDFTAEKDGYYAIEFNYSHEDTESLVKGEITYPDGTTAVLFEGFPHGSEKSVVNLFLKQGVSHMHFCAPWELVLVKDIKNLGLTESFEYRISPNNSLYFCDAPKTMQMRLKNYRKELAGIKTDTGVQIPFEIKQKPLDDACTAFMADVTLDADAVKALGEGVYTLTYTLCDGTEISQTLTIKKETPKTEFKIVNFDVGCANSTLLMLPNGKNMLVDSATEDGARDVVIPYLEKNSINIDYYLLTHFHGDHNGLMDEILEKYGIEKPNQEEADKLVTADKATRGNYLKNFGYLDSTMLCFYDELHNVWDLGGVTIEVLNSRYYENGKPLKVYKYPFVKNNEHNYENSTSVSFMLDYNGFRYYHGADNYAFSQNRIIADFARMDRENELNCHHFFGNHHFICNTSAEFVNTLNPCTVFVPSGDEIQCRSTYTRMYKNEVEKYYFSGKRLTDTLISGEVGNVRVCVNSGDDWYYENLPK